MGISREREYHSSKRDTPEKFDAIVALGQNIRFGWNRERIRKDKRHISTPSKRVAIAAAMHYLEGHAGQIIFSTGYNSGRDIPSEAEAMRNYVKRRFGERVPESIMKAEKRSFDTSTNAEQVGIILRNGGYDRVALLTPTYHKRRAMGLFEAWDIHVMKFLSAEDKLKERSKHHAAYVRKLKRSPLFWFAEYLKEIVLDLERYILFDPKALHPRRITQRTRK